MSDSESATSLMDLVASYTPCSSDTLGLLLSSDEIAESISNQYASLSETSKVIFNQGVMEDDTTYRQRLDFILAAHEKTLSVNPESIKEISKNSMIVFMIILFTGFIVYGTTKRKYR
jgi:hypothetical protein